MNASDKWTEKDPIIRAVQWWCYCQERAQQASGLGGCFDLLGELGLARVDGVSPIGKSQAISVDAGRVVRYCTSREIFVLRERYWGEPGTAPVVSQLRSGGTELIGMRATWQPYSVIARKLGVSQRKVRRLLTSGRDSVARALWGRH